MSDNRTPAPTDQSVGELVSEVTADTSQLFRQEVALARAEIKEDLKTAGVGAGLLAGALVLTIPGITILGISGVDALNSVMTVAQAAALVGLAILVVAVILALMGKSRLQRVDPAPHRTVDTVKQIPQTMTGGQQ